MKKVGIITFHNSYNCGSMLESYAMQKSIEKYCNDNVEIIDFSNDGQKDLYKIFFKNNCLKNILKNILLLPNYKQLKMNNIKYEEFRDNNFYLSKNKFKSMEELNDKDYNCVVSGSDQIWNITIADADDAYFLPWVNNAKKVAYAPSFGSKNIMKYANNPEKYKKYLLNYDYLSIREKNGQKWINKMINKNVPILIDPTLILPSSCYDEIMAHDINEKEKYIFFYCPSFNQNICKYVRKISKKYNLKVITWSCKSYSTRMIKIFGFELAKYENPASYLYYIKNAELILTTSFHGTIFSTIYNKKFFTIKNGDMYGDDDRVITLLSQLKMLDRLIAYDFDNDFDYLQDIDYSKYDNQIKELRMEAINYLKESVGGKNEGNK